MKQNHYFKRTLSALLLLLASTFSWAQDFTARNADGVTIYYNLINDGAEAEVTNNYGSAINYSGDVNIPETVEYDGKTLSVTSIGNWAFNGCRLTSVNIPNSVTSIGESAFKNCSLTSIIIPESVTSIGEEAFYFCSLTSITIPNSVTSIGWRAFSNCISLTSISVDKGNPIYDSRDNCNAIIETATNTLHIGCQSTVIPNSVTTIGYRAFYECRGLISVTIPNSVTSIEKSAFYGCSNLPSITIPESVTSIGEYAFQHCSSLTSITIPNNVKSIGEHAFFGCSSLTSVNIPESVTSIGEGAFYRCSSLTSVNIPESVISIGNEAFRECSGLTSVNIGNSVTSIGDYAFYYCRGLTSVNMGNSVTSIGEEAFYLCSSLTSITIPESVTSIGNQAFYSCSSLTSITIPSSVTSIGEKTFLYCSGLTSITIPESVTSIGESAFQSCISLTSVNIPNSVTTISRYAFRYCQSLTTIICRAENVPILGNLFSPQVFGGVPTSEARLYVPASALEEYKTATQWKDFGTTLPIVELDYALKTGWNTIALPFSADLETFGEGAKAYAFTGAENGTLNFSIADRLEAHTPYIIYAPEMQELSLNNFHDSTDPNATTEPGVAHGGITFRGTYEDIEAPGMEGKYGLADDGRLRKGSAQASIKAYHAYFEVAPGTEVKGITLDGDDATGIAVTADAPQRNGWYYNLAGQRTQKPRKGVNIVGGRKVLY